MEYWNSQRIRALRMQKLTGSMNPACGICQHQDEIGNHSKRIKENLKSVIFYDHNFQKSYDQSPHKKFFDYSLANGGLTQTSPLSYHLSLGNDCDLACVMCGPQASYKLGRDYQALGWIKENRRMNWTDDPVVWNDFCRVLLETPNLLSLHIVGGEPLINKRFIELLDLLVRENRTDLSFSFTTNANHRLDHFYDRLAKFSRVDIGLSVETISNSNDYVRYGSKIDSILSNIDHIKRTAPSNVELVIRTVPTMLTITEYDRVIDWCWQEDFLLYSYFAVNPAWQQIQVLPTSLRETLIPRYQALLEKLKYSAQDRPSMLTNFRNQSYVVENCIKETHAAINALKREHRADLVPEAIEKFKQLDTHRKQDVRKAFPILADWFNSNGY